MPVGAPTERKAGTATTSGAGVFTFSPATNCTTGATLILLVSGGVVTSVTDDGGVNAWNIDRTQATGNTDRNSICSSYQTTGLTTARTITVTCDVLSTGVAYWFEEFPGNYSAVDKTASSTGSNSTSLPTGTTAATSDADEFAVAIYNTRATGAITKNASYTVFTTGQQAHPTNPQGLGAYRLLSATGTQNADGTDANMVTSANGIATYKSAAAAFVADPIRDRLQAMNRASVW